MPYFLFSDTLWPTVARTCIKGVTQAKVAYLEITASINENGKALRVSQVGPQIHRPNKARVLQALPLPGVNECQTEQNNPSTAPPQKHHHTTTPPHHHKNTKTQPQHHHHHHHHKNSHHFRTLGDVWWQSFTTAITSVELWAMFDDNLLRNPSLQ